MDLRKQMMELWSDTFHDSDDYIKLVFDTYFNPDFVVYEEDQGKLTSALMGIPYTFGWTEHSLRGLYLCGLATREQYRHLGLMTSLLDKINEKAKRDGFAFTFLLPANDGLRKYYYDRGYVNASYIIENRFTKIHDFYREYETIISSEDERVRKIKISRFENLNIDKIDIKNTELLQNCIRYIKSQEYSKSYPCLRHDDNDIIAIIEDNILSRGEIFISQNKDGEISGVAFLSRTQDAIVNIQHIYYSDKASRFKLLQVIKQQFPESGIVVCDYPEESGRSALWGANVMAAPGSEFHGESRSEEAVRVYKVSDHAAPLAMLKFLNADEILKFLSYRRSECKYSILVKSPDSDEILRYSVDRGVFKREVVKKREGDVVFTLQQLQEVVCRRPSDDNTVMEAFGIPRLPLNMSLLLE